MSTDISLKEIYDLINAGNANISQKVDGVKKELTDLSLKYNKEISDIRCRVDLLQKEHKVLKDRLEVAEGLLKRNNLIVYGIVEEDEETDLEILSKIIDILKERLKINLSIKDFSNCFRLGVKNNRSRPILVELLSQLHKRDILRHRSSLKGTNIFINEDLSTEARKERKILLEEVKRARPNNKKAILKGNKVLIDGVLYTYSDVVGGRMETSKSGYCTPPPVGAIVSEPSTPSAPPIQEEEHISNSEEAFLETGNIEANIFTKSIKQQSDRSQYSQDTSGDICQQQNGVNNRRIEQTPSKLISNNKRVPSSVYATRSNLGKTQKK